MIAKRDQVINEKLRLVIVPLVIVQQAAVPLVHKDLLVTLVLGGVLIGCTLSVLPAYKCANPLLQATV